MLPASKIVLSSVSIVAIIILDQISKNYFPGVCNGGIAFGLLESFKTPNLIFTFIIISIGVYLLLVWSHGILDRLALILIIGGGVSNFLDRLLLGCVRDFISIGVFPSFNLADASLSFGLTIGLLITIFKKRTSVEDHLK